MGYSKTIVCLANSRREKGRCVAGVEIIEEGFGDWVRPISKNSSKGTILKRDRSYENGDEPKLLDVIAMEFSRHTPKRYQRENHIIDDGFYWARMGCLTWDDIQQAVDNPQTLWTNNSSSTNGTNDRVPKRKAAKLKNSLYLIRPDNLEIVVAKEQVARRRKPKLRVRARFRYRDDQYYFVVTDPVAEERYGKQYKDKKKRVIPVDEALLCVSLAEPYRGYAYKLVAGVITPDMADA